MKRIVLSLIFCFSGVFTFADEGMWLMAFIDRLKYSDWQKEGLHLTPEEIYSVNQASLKDAIVSFGGYCTGEVVSNQGLVFTNHHCGYGAIAQLSTPENDYLHDGFWAKSFEEELKPDNLYVRFLVRMDNVTSRIVRQLNDKMTSEQRGEIINAEIEKIKRENNENGRYEVVVKDFYGGNEFYYFVYQDYHDVRLVGTPPESVGKYGGTYDNWEWPRHTGDFSIFRVYADANGNPAEYSPSNVPLKPKHHLPIKKGGVKPGDFAMTIGYPGSTERYMSSFGIQQALDIEFPAWIDAAANARAVLKKYMDSDNAINLNYASKYASIDNYWKNRIGMTQALNKLRTYDKKKEIEKNLTQWIDNDPTRKAKYGNVLKDIQNYYQISNDYIANQTYISRGVLPGSSLVLVAYRMKNLFDTYHRQDAENQKNMLPQVHERIESQYENFSAELEREALAVLLQKYYENTAEIYHHKALKDALKEYGNFSQFVEANYENSIFRNATALKQAFANNDLEAFNNDPIFKISAGLIDSYQNVPENVRQAEEKYEKAYRLFIQALRESQPNKVFYPDANFTMRLSTGKVVSLPENPTRPSDVSSNYYTTLKGGMRKFLPNSEFDMPTELIRLYNTQTFGQWADENGNMPVCFLTDNDITGGNSGSPVIGGNGELLGLAFDGNWEAMSGDIEFEKDLQRTINVDIRYVMFIIEQLSGADRIINELDFVD